MSVAVAKITCVLCICILCREVIFALMLTGHVITNVDEHGGKSWTLAISGDGNGDWEKFPAAFYLGCLESHAMVAARWVGATRLCARLARRLARRMLS